MMKRIEKNGVQIKDQTERRFTPLNNPLKLTYNSLSIIKKY